MSYDYPITSTAGGAAGTAKGIIWRALKLLGLLAAGEAPTSEDQADGIVELNHVLSTWANERLLVHGTRRDTHTLTASLSPHTIGDASGIGTTRPVRIDRAGVIRAGDTAETPLIDGSADYTKGNRFRDFQAVRAMPFVRRIGNVALSFLSKAATGYWHCFDPTNGFVAIRADVLSQMPLKKIDPTYFFETSMLSHLYVLGAVVKEVPMPARYVGETSSLSITRVLRQFPGKLVWSLIRRLVLKNFVYDFNLESFHILAGVPLLLLGMLYGGYHWWWYSSRNLAAPTGTVVLSALLITIGMQLLISAVNLDLQSIPREPINAGAIRVEGAQRSDAALESRVHAD